MLATAKRLLSRWIAFEPWCAQCGRTRESYELGLGVVAVLQNEPGLCVRCLSAHCAALGLPPEWRLHVSEAAWSIWKSRPSTAGTATLDDNQRIRIPGIVPVTLEPWRDVLRRDPCAYCGQAGGTVDHVTALGQGGPNTVENLIGSCAECNQRKKAHPLWKFLMATRRYDAIEWARKAQGDKRPTIWHYESLVSRCKPMKPMSSRGTARIGSLRDQIQQAIGRAS